MPDKKVAVLTQITTVEPYNDFLPIVDVSDTTMAISGTTKKITPSQLLQSGVPLVVPQGSQAAPSISFSSDSNTGIYSPTGDQVSISAGGSGTLTVTNTGLAIAGATSISGNLAVDTSTLFVDSVANRVGVGTVTPAGRLSSAGETGQSGFNAGTLTSPIKGNLWYETDGSGWKFQIGKWQSSTFTPQMTFQDNGNVGIGPTSPLAPLHVETAAASSLSAVLAQMAASGGGGDVNFKLVARNGSGTTGVSESVRFGLEYQPTSSSGTFNSGLRFMRGGGSSDGYLIACTSGQDRMTLSIGGQLGLGVTPSAWSPNFRAFETASGYMMSANDGTVLQFGNNVFLNAAGNYEFKASGYASLSQQYQGEHHWYNSSATGAPPNTFSPVMRMKLDASGNLSVGSGSAQYTATGRGNVTSSGSSEAIFGLSINNTPSGYLWGTSTNVEIGAPAGRFISFSINGEKARITSTGVLQLTNSLYLSQAQGVEAGIDSSGPKSLMDFIYSLSMAHNVPDIFRYKTVQNRQLWNGSAWVTDSATDWTACLNPNMSTACTVISAAEYALGWTQKRFTIDVGSDWARPNFVMLQRVWSESDWPFSVQLESSLTGADGTFTTYGTQTVSSTQSIAYFSNTNFQQPRYYRITISATQAITSGALVISKIMALGPRYNVLNPFTVDYNRNTFFAANVGIGTSSTLNRAQIQGAGQATTSVSDSGDGSALFLSDTGFAAGNGGLLLLGASSANGQRPHVGIKSTLDDTTSFGTSDMIFVTRTTNAATTLSEKMRLTKGGNLGLGVTPSAKVDVALAGNGTPRVRITSVSDNPILEFQRWMGSGTNYYGNRIITDNIGLYFQTSNQASIGSQTFTTRLTLKDTGQIDVSGTTAVSWSGASPTLSGLVNVGTGGASGASFVVNTPSLNATYTSGLAVDGTYSNPGGVGTSFVNLKALGVASGGGYDSAMRFWTSSGTTASAKMTLDSVGRLGIGVVPQLPLHVVYNGQAELRLQNSSANGLAAIGFQAGGQTNPWYIATDSSRNFWFQDNATIRLHIASTGVIGIGGAPTGWTGGAIINLPTAGAISSKGTTISIVSNAYFADQWRYYGNGRYAQYLQSDGSHVFYGAANNTLGADQPMTPLQYVTIDASGNLGVGVTPTQKIHTNGNILLSGGNGTALTWDNGLGSQYLKYESAIDGLSLAGWNNLTFFTQGNERFRITSVGQMRASANGTASLPAYSHSTDFDTGLYFPTANNTLAMSVGGSDAVYIDSSRNVGLGVTPSAWNTSFRAIELSSASLMSANDASAAFFAANTSFNASSQWIYKGNGKSAIYQISNDGLHTWYNSGTTNGSGGAAYSPIQRMALDASGQLGLGVTPSAWKANTKAIQLGPYGNSYTTLFSDDSGFTNLGCNFFVNSAGTSAYVTAAAAGSFRIVGKEFRWLQSTSTPAIGADVVFNQAMTLDANGNLGVGTTGPSAPLTVKTRNSDSVGIRVLQSTGGTASIQFTNDPVSAQWGLISATSTSVDVSSVGTLSLTANGAQRIHISAAGNVGIGVTPVETGKLEIGGGTSGQRLLFSNTANNTAARTMFAIGYRTPATSGYDPIVCATESQYDDSVQLRFHSGPSGAERLRLDSSGNAVFGNAALATNATNGFLYIPSCPGTPSGNPTAYAGRVPLVWDSTNNILYIRSGNSWKPAYPPA